MNYLMFYGKLFLKLRVLILVLWPFVFTKKTKRHKKVMSILCSKMYHNLKVSTKTHQKVLNLKALLFIKRKIKYTTDELIRLALDLLEKRV